MKVSKAQVLQYRRINVMRSLVGDLKTSQDNKFDLIMKELKSMKEKKNERTKS